MRAMLLPRVDLAALDRALLLPNGCMRLMPADELREFGMPTLQAWAVARARYQLVTRELVDYLREKIADRHAIEIGSGQGDLAHHLGIRGTDSCVQVDNRGVREYYRLLGQEPTDPPPFIERLNALEAVARHRPAVVVGTWVTQLWQEGSRAGSVYGVDEDVIIDAVESYIHVGNHASHADKPACARAHAVERYPWLVTRSMEPSGNFVQIWGK